MNKKVLFRGSATALITPFTKTGEVDLHELGRIIEFQILEGTDAIVICGTTGEAPTLSDIEHQRIIDHAASIIGKRVPLIAGTGSNDTSHAVMMSKCAAANGADGLLLVSPYYNRTTNEGLVKSYLTIADAVDLPMLIYNVPSRTSVDIPFEVYRELSQHPNLAGVKEASGNIGKFSRLCAELGEDFSVYSGCDDNVISTLAVGGSGVISVTANILPGYMHEMCKKWFERKYDDALSMHRRISHLNALLFSEVNPIPIKSAMKMLGFSTGELRLPLVEMSGAGKARLRAEMKRLDIIG